MTHFTSIKPGWPLAAMTIAMSMALTACSGDEGQESRVDAELIILQPDQSPSDVITGGTSTHNVWFRVLLRSVRHLCRTRLH